MAFLTVIPSERRIIGNCITAKVKPDLYNLDQVLQNHIEAASPCFGNTENLNGQVLIQK